MGPMTRSHQPLLAGEVAGAQQVVLLRPQETDGVGVALPVLAVPVVAEVADGGGPGVGGVAGGGAVGGAVVLLEEAVQVPGDGGVHGVVAAAVGGEQAGFGGPVQQRDPRLAVRARPRRAPGRRPGRGRPWRGGRRRR